MLLSIFMWLAIGAVVGVVSAFAVPANSYGWRGDVAIGIAGAVVGGLAWPMAGIYLGVGVFNAAVGGLMGVLLVLPAMRMIRPDLFAFLYPKI
jgi:uncharacterized membrane protein YeaQ/YmgE (transglycosylase-associated protein family)